jgi:DNA-binding transcriptional MocR family regulator
MLSALTHYLPAEARYVKPEGGLFLWVQLPGGVSAGDLYPLAAAEGVTLVPGSVFFPGEGVQSYLRLNFAIHSPEVIEEGVRRLGRAIERCLAMKQPGNGSSQRSRVVTL